MVDVEAMEAKQGLADVLKYALIVVSTAPILCMYPFIQRYLIKGAMIGSVKGIKNRLTHSRQPIALFPYLSISSYSAMISGRPAALTLATYSSQVASMSTLPMIALA